MRRDRELGLDLLALDVIGHVRCFCMLSLRCRIDPLLCSA